MLNLSTLRPAIIVMTLFTAGVHLSLGISGIAGGDITTLSVLFVLNGIGYLTLLAAGLLVDAPFFVENRSLVFYLLAAFAVVTIIAWIPSGSYSPLAFATKADEVLLTIAAVMYAQRV